MVNFIYFPKKLIKINNIIILKYQFNLFILNVDNTNNNSYFIFNVILSIILCIIFVNFFISK